MRRRLYEIMKPDTFAAQLKISNRDEQVFFLGQQKNAHVVHFLGVEPRSLLYLCIQISYRLAIETIFTTTKDFTNAQ